MESLPSANHTGPKGNVTVNAGVVLKLNNLCHFSSDSSWSLNIQVTAWNMYTYIIKYCHPDWELRACVKAITRLYISIKLSFCYGIWDCNNPSWLSAQKSQGWEEWNDNYMGSLCQPKDYSYSKAPCSAVICCCLKWFKSFGFRKKQFMFSFTQL